MKFLKLAFIIQFLVTIWPKTDIISKLREQYGQNTLKLFRQVEKTLLRLRKIDQDIQFIVKCQELKLIPTFCKLKPANRKSLSNRDYTALQCQVLSLELKSKRRQLFKLKQEYGVIFQQLKSSVGYITFISLCKFLHNSAVSQCGRTSVRHAKKIANLRRDHGLDVYLLDSTKVVVNLSSYTLSNTELSVLRRGLDFSILPRQLDHVDVMTSFETFFRQFSPGVTTEKARLKHKVRDLCYKYLYGYNPANHKNLSKEEESAFHHLKKNENIIICRPDKGSGVVIMDRSDYIAKLETIVGDTSKFVQLPDDPTDQREARLQRYLYSLKKKGCLDETTYSEIRPTGSTPARLYGLPKTHKQGTPVRPIISSIGTYTYGLAKFLVKVLQPVCTSEHSVKDSFTFVEELKTVHNAHYMVSFDVVSLFTNVPLDETINLCLDRLYHDVDKVHNLDRGQLKKLLYFACKESHFLFNGKMYDQVDGVAMGSPLGPVLADIFMSSVESVALETFTGVLPNVYRRYVDDVFLAFNCRDDMLLFFDWLNAQHVNAKFTLEEERDNKLSFLDVLVERLSDDKLCTCVFRKANFSGLYLQWDSLVPKQHKRGLVIGLICRAWRLCSSYDCFHQELSFLKDVLRCNGYPSTFIDSCVNRCLSKMYCTQSKEDKYGPDKKLAFLCLPYCGTNSVKVKRQILRLLSNVAPWVQPRIVFKPVLKFSALSRLKCQFPLLTNSNLVYKVQCKDCSAFYIGKTIRRLHQRLKEHSEDEYSALHRHANEQKHVIDFECPSILAKDSNKSRLLVKEALLISEHKAYASLNGNTGSTELHLW